MTELPELIRRCLDRNAPPRDPLPRLVRLMQVGQMWTKRGGRAMSFRAPQELAVAEVAFSWRARFRLVPFVSLHVVDGYADGQGELEARLLGVVPVMRARGPELDEGEAMRYLSELPWVPHAMLANRHLVWAELDGRTVEVATQVGPTRVPVRLELDEAYAGNATFF